MGIYLFGFVKSHFFTHSSTWQTFAKGLFCAGNIAGLAETAVDKTPRSRPHGPGV